MNGSTRMARAIVAAGAMAIAAGAAAGVTASAQHTAAASAAPPLSLEDALKLSEHRGFSLSPDGAWLAYSYEDTSADTTRLRVLEIATGSEIDLAPSRYDTTNPAWSPSSQWLAFHSNETGTPQLWIWNRTTRTARPMEDAELFDVGWASPEWFADSTRVVTPLWPEGVARPPKKETPDSKSPFRPPFEPVGPEELSVYVHSAHGDAKTESSAKPAAAPASNRDRVDQSRPHCDRPPFGTCDLGVVDVTSGAVTRIVRRAVLSWFHQPSPDGRSVAYAVFTGASISTQMQFYDLHVVDVATGRDRLVARDLNTYAGITFAWSPDNTRIAHLKLRTKYEGPGDRYKVTPADLAVIALDGSGEQVFDSGTLPTLYGRPTPLWSADSQRLYALTVDRQLVEVNVGTGTGRTVAALPGHQIKRVAVPLDTPVLWSPTRDRRVLLEVENPAASTSGFYEVDLDSGTTAILLERAQDLYWSDVSPKTGAIAFRSSNQHSPGDLWLWTSRDREPQRVGSLNAFLTKVALGSARRLTWRAADGRELAGTLLLPPDYTPGTRVPLFVWVYGGKMGSEDMNRFGFAAGAGIATFNAQILASRGYAVLSPDVPQRMGTPMSDIVETVMPGVDAAIAGGFADPDRLAVGGHSYGSYSTMAIVTQTRRFKAAIISGVLDMNLESNYLRFTNLGTANDRWSETGQGLMGGTPWEVPERYRANSPIHDFDKITTPVLIGQGEIDTVTPITGANGTFAALRRLGKPVEYRIYEGDGHGFRRAANILDFWKRRLEFLAEHLDVALDAHGRVVIENGRAKPRAHARSSAER